MRTKPKTVTRKRTAPGKHMPDLGKLLRTAAWLLDKLNDPDFRDMNSRTRPAATDKERRVAILRAFRAFRAAALPNQDDAFYMIASCAERWAGFRLDTDPELTRLRTAMDAIKQREGLEDGQGFPMDDRETPQDWTALRRQWDRRFDEIRAAILREYGEGDIADLLLTNRRAYTRRYNAGQQKTIGRAAEKRLLEELPGTGRPSEVVRKGGKP